MAISAKRRGGRTEGMRRRVGKEGKTNETCLGQNLGRSSIMKYAEERGMQQPPVLGTEGCWPRATDL